MKPSSGIHQRGSSFSLERFLRTSKCARRDLRRLEICELEQLDGPYSPHAGESDGCWSLYDEQYIISDIIIWRVEVTDRRGPQSLGAMHNTTDVHRRILSEGRTVSAVLITLPSRQKVDKNNSKFSLNKEPGFVLGGVTTYQHFAYLEH